MWLCFPSANIRPCSTNICVAVTFGLCAHKKHAAKKFAAAKKRAADQKTDCLLTDGQAVALSAVFACLSLDDDFYCC